MLKPLVILFRRFSYSCFVLFDRLNTNNLITHGSKTKLMFLIFRIHVAKMYTRFKYPQSVFGIFSTLIHLSHFEKFTGIQSTIYKVSSCIYRKLF